MKKSIQAFNNADRQFLDRFHQLEADLCTIQFTTPAGVCLNHISNAGSWIKEEKSIFGAWQTSSAQAVL